MICVAIFLFEFFDQDLHMDLLQDNLLEFFLLHLVLGKNIVFCKMTISCYGV